MISKCKFPKLVTVPLPGILPCNSNNNPPSESDSPLTSSKTSASSSSILQKSTIGVLASKTVKPVIGVPVNVKISGIDSILSIVQMPPGIPTASVGLDNSTNAALLAIEILALNNSELGEKLVQYREKMKKDIEDANKEL